MITSGIISFESTLLTIISLQKERINQTRLFRVISIASQVKSVLQKKANNLIKEIRDAEYIRNVAIEKGKQREEYLREEFKIRVKTYSNWLSLDMLLGSYQEKVAQALETRCFNNWQDSQFKSTILNYTQSIEKWANQSCDEFQKGRPNRIKISFPSYPHVSLPQLQETDFGQWFGDIFNGGKTKENWIKNMKEKNGLLIKLLLITIYINFGQIL